MNLIIETAANKRERYEAEKAREAEAWLDEAIEKCLPIIISKINSTNFYTKCNVTIYDSDFPNAQFSESEDYKTFIKLVIDFLTADGYDVTYNFVSALRDDGRGVIFCRLEFAISW